MDRRLFLTGVLGVAGTTAVASIFPRPAAALVPVPPEDLALESDVLPDLEDPAEQLDEDIEPASYRRRRRRRWRHRRWYGRRRRRYYRRRCRRYRRYGYWRRRCRRRRRGIGISVWIG